LNQVYVISKQGKMAQKRSLRVKKEKPSKQQGKAAPEPSEAAEKPFDFGGLPDRDIKKNLGCG
jgi:hypothetical protein